MRRLILTTVLAAMFATAATAATTRPDPVYVPGGSYTAVLNQAAQRWTLLPLDGHDVEIRADAKTCASSIELARGIWLVGRDAQGRPELVSPSSTGDAETRIALQACGDAGNGYAAPRALIDWLATETGAVYVD